MFDSLNQIAAFGEDFDGAESGYVQKSDLIRLTGILEFACRDTIRIGHNPNGFQGSSGFSPQIRRLIGPRIKSAAVQRTDGICFPTGIVAAIVYRCDVIVIRKTSNRASILILRDSRRHRGNLSGKARDPLLNR